MRRLYSLALFFVMVAAVYPLSSAEAHTHSVYFAAVWNTSQVNVGYDKDFPENVSPYMWRNRIRDAGEENWPEASTGRPNIAFYDNETDYNFNCISGGEEAIMMVNLGLDVAAKTCVLQNSSTHIISNMRIRINAPLSWYIQDTTPIPSPYNTTHYDLEAVTTHEFGHFLGFTLGDGGGHFDQDDTACPGPAGTSTENTMCAGGTAPGEQYTRSPESHDISTMLGAYTHYP